MRHPLARSNEPRISGQHLICKHNNRALTVREAFQGLNGLPAFVEQVQFALNVLNWEEGPHRIKEVRVKQPRRPIFYGGNLFSIFDWQATFEACTYEERDCFFHAQSAIIASPCMKTMVHLLSLPVVAETLDRTANLDSRFQENHGEIVLHTPFDAILESQDARFRLRASFASAKPYPEGSCTVGNQVRHLRIYA